MIKKPSGVINMSQLGVDEKYLQLPTDIRKEVCQRIIEGAMGKMSVKASQSQRIDAMKKILETSIRYYEEIEEYENCIILKDLMDTLA